MMHVEIGVALNFLISFLYNKLPRRRVNQFGGELESALMVKFEGHWYPEKPFKGSAFRCLKTTPPLDPVFDIAARESGMDLLDIQENLPHELSIWIDPGEVSYRMSEKGPVKILYSEHDRCTESDNAEREIIRTFNPDAQCFKPIENQFASLSISPTPGSVGTCGTVVAPPPVSTGPTANVQQSPPQQQYITPPGSNVTPNNKNGSNNSNSGTGGAFMPKTSTPTTFTTASFAQTKFGSTKLKSNTKRSHRMSPTEFSNYIKQRALLQQQQVQYSSSCGAQNSPPNGTNFGVYDSPNNQRSLSPNYDNSNFIYINGNGNVSPTFGYSNGFTPRLQEKTSPVNNGNGVNSGILSPVNSNNVLSRFASFLDKASPYVSQQSVSPPPISPDSPPFNLSASDLTNQIGSNLSSREGEKSPDADNSPISSNGKSSFESLNFNLNGYPNQYRPLLVAN